MEKFVIRDNDGRLYIGNREFSFMQMPVVFDNEDAAVHERDYLLSFDDADADENFLTIIPA